MVVDMDHAEGARESLAYAVFFCVFSGLGAVLLSTMLEDREIAAMLGPVSAAMVLLNVFVTLHAAKRAVWRIVPAGLATAFGAGLAVWIDYRSIYPRRPSEAYELGAGPALTIGVLLLCWVFVLLIVRRASKRSGREPESAAD